MADVFTFTDFSKMSREAADLTVRALRDALGGHDRATLTLAGGSTPREMYGLLAERSRGKLRWDRIDFLMGDERLVPPDSPDSNFRMAREALLDRLSLPAENLHPVRTELPGEEAAADYARTVRALCAAASRRTGSHRGPADDAAAEPQLDVVLLGMGPDGHTASLFPGSAALAASELVVAAPAPPLKPQVPRITMTLALLNSARHVIFLISGSEKIRIVQEILGAGSRPLPYPASLVRPRGRLSWFLHDTR